MVRIISEGVPPCQVEHQVQCNQCKTVFAFTIREAKMHYDFRDGDYMEIACPVCNGAVTKSVR